jgi:hypothetical protein
MYDKIYNKTKRKPVDYNNLIFFVNRDLSIENSRIELTYARE